MALLHIYALLFVLFQNILADRPGPPQILGPVTTESTFIRVAHVVKDAKVTVKDAVTGVVIAEGLGTGAEFSIPTRGTPFILGHDVIAEQQAPDGSKSGPGKSLVKIVDVILPGTPAIISRTHLCMQAIKVDNIVLGATIVAQIGLRIFASQIADKSPIWLALDPVVSRLEGERMEIKQSITYSSGTYYHSAFTEPLQSFRTFMNLRIRGPLSVKEPLSACDKKIEFTYATPGSLLTQFSVSYTATSHSPDFQHTLHMPLPLEEGLLRVTEDLWNRCEEVELEQSFLVEYAKAVNPPTTNIWPCSDSPTVHFDNLFGGGTLFLYRKDAMGEDILYWPIADDKTSDDFPLPEGWLRHGEDAELKFWQVNPCNKDSPKTTLKLDDSPPNTHLVITPPIYECSSFVTYESGETSAETFLWTNADESLSDSFKVDPHAAPANVHTPVLFRPLKTSDNVYLTQVGCGTNLRTQPSIPVEALPNQLPSPDIPNDIFTSQQYIYVTKVLKGATVKIYVDSEEVFPPIPIEYGSAEALSDTVFVPIDAPVSGFWPYPISLGKSVVARQFFPLCNREQIVESDRSNSKTVLRGFLKATWSDTSVHKIHVPGGLVQVLHLQVTDQISGACVRGRVESRVDHDRGYMFPKDISSAGCMNLCDCDMEFTIPAEDRVSSLIVTIQDHAGAFHPVQLTITVLDAVDEVLEGFGNKWEL